MDREMLRAGQRQSVLGIVSLQPLNKGHPHPGSQKCVFAVGFLTAAPAWIAEQIDIGRPEVQPVPPGAVAIVAAV